MNYHQLYYFWTIAKAGSFKAAGKRLLLAVSTLSVQIGQLERSLGIRLFERSRRGVTLTPEGRLVYDHCERIFGEGDALLAAVRSGSPAAPAQLRLGVQTSISAWIVLKLIDFVSRLEPRVHVSVVGGNQQGLQDRLRNHALDIALTNFDYTLALGRDFASRLVGKLPVSFVGTPRVKRRIRRFPESLAEVPLLVRTDENPIRRSLDAYLRERGVTPRVDIEIENTQLIRLLALQGRGAAVIDTFTINEDLASGRLVRLHARPTGMEEYIWLLYNARPKSHPALASVMAALTKDFLVSL